MNKSCLLIPAIILATATSVDAKKKKKKDEPAPVAAVQDTTKKTPPAKSIKDKVKSSKKIDGLFTLYQDTATGSLQMYIKKNQLGKEYIYQSFSMGGPTSMFLNQNMIRTTWVFDVKKVNDKLEFAQKNTNFYFDSTKAISKAANVDVSDAIFFSDKIASEDEDGYLIAVDGLFLSEKLDPVKPAPIIGLPPGMMFTLGGLNPLKSNYQGIRSFDKNTDVIVNLAYDNPMPMNQGGKDITDARYVRVKMQHTFLEVPQNNYKPRYDDPRVGYFTSEVDDMTSLAPTPYKDVIHRWNLVKKDPNAALSEPVEPIVFWIENTTPVELRPIIKEAGEKWNEAFEKAGFKNAVVMKIMPDDAKWDPADLNYNVIRWTNSAYPSYGAIGPVYTNPKTGQILGSDITVEWKSGAGVSTSDELYNSNTGAFTAMPWDNPAEAATTVPYKFSVSKNGLSHCNLANEITAQYQTGVAAIATLDGDDNYEVTGKVSDLHKQFLYYLILHEMGHTLGLNHNMKASQMLTPAQLNDKALTAKLGTQGSVMDYPSINVSLDRSKQGDYYTTKPGPYDLWAIEFGYRPFGSAAEETAGLNKILSRSNEPYLAFGNDADDMRSSGNGIDPRVMINDHSSDMATFGEEKFKLVNAMLPKLKARFATEGKSYQDLRTRYSQLVRQRADMVSALSRYVGGVYVDRSFVGQPNVTNKPYTPVPADYQKKVMNVLSQYVFAPNAFDADTELFPYLQGQRRGFGFFGSPEDVKPQNTFSNLQMTALAHLLHPTTLSRITNSGTYGNTYTVADVINDLNKAIFNADLNGNVNIYRQNLQTNYVNALSRIASATVGYDNISKAAALHNLKKVKTLLAGAASPNESTRAHRTSLNFIIDKALSVK